MMRRFLLPALAVWLLSPAAGRAYIEAPHSLGKCVHDSSNVVLLELVRVNTEKNLLIYKKVADLKGKHPTEEVKHNIGNRGFHEREWKRVMAWAEPGKRAVFMYSGNASITCIGTHWYQCYQEGEWWGMSHAEPFMLRTFYGDPERLAGHIARMLKGEEVVVTCLADGNKEQFHQGKGKVQRMRASLKKLDYDPKRDFVGWGGDGDDLIEEFRTVELIPAGADRWRFLPAAAVAKEGENWAQHGFDHASWRTGKAPIGYGEDEIARRKGTTVAEHGQDFVFRRSVEVPAELLAEKGVTFRLAVASDDNAVVYLNGVVVDRDPVDDHEFAYWNREVEIPPKHFRPGRNIIAVRVKNHQGSSDLYLDLELTATVPLPRKPAAAPAVAANAPKTSPAAQPKPADEPRDPNALKVDPATKTVTVACRVAPRKLPNLDQKYPIEVIATYPAPRGQKAHETVVTFQGVRPSDVHKALESLGLKPGKPAYGDAGKAAGPEVKLFLELPSPGGKTERVPLEKVLVHRDGGKPMVELTWYFTGSAEKQPDPEKDEKVYGADLTGTLAALFPVTDSTVFQTQLTMKDEPNFKLETNPQVLPKEGTELKLVIVVP
jgi:hypothetical protein